MSPEEFQRIKDAEKEHLRQLKKLKSAVRRLGRQQRLTQAVNDLTAGPQDALDTHSELVDQLAFETARQEARLEIALENQASEDDAAPEPPEVLEEDLLKARAQTLVRQIKQQMGVPGGEDDAGAPPAPPERAAPAAPDTRPEKTLGRTAPAPRIDAGPRPSPDKTLGRPPRER